MLLSWLPRAMQALILPLSWCLPANIVLKKLKPGWEEEFANKKHMYTKLKRLQGEVIPIFYGEARCDDGTPALILSDVGGVPLWHESAFELAEMDLKKMLQASFGSLASYGVYYDDLKLDNLRFVGDKIVILDLENVDTLNSPAERAINLAVDEVLSLWRYYRKHGRPTE